MSCSTWEEELSQPGGRNPEFGADVSILCGLLHSRWRGHRDEDIWDSERGWFAVQKSSAGGERGGHRLGRPSSREREKMWGPRAKP